MKLNEVRTSFLQAEINAIMKKSFNGAKFYRRKDMYLTPGLVAPVIWEEEEMFDNKYYMDAEIRDLINCGIVRIDGNKIVLQPDNETSIYTLYRV